jgi:hypothetical protein
MQPLQVAIKVALVVQRFLGDQDPLPILPVVDVPRVRHGPILLLVPIPSIIPTSLT